ncbi:hypothetical protein ACHAXH_003477 [Discostella pseudostelligera]
MTMDDDDAGNDQAFITQPMTQQCNIREITMMSPCIEGGISELQPVNGYANATDEQDFVQENVDEENATNAFGGTQSRQSVAMNYASGEHETNVVGATILSESVDHYEPITAPAVPPPPLPPQQSLTNNGCTVNTIEIRQTAQPPEKKHAVINPYAKKRPSDQISRSSSSNTSLGATNNDSSTSTSSTHNNLHTNHHTQTNNAADAGSTVPRKPVYNPYAKSNTSVLGRKSIAGTMNAVATPHTIHLPSNNVVGNAARDDGVPSGTIRKPSPPAAVPPPQQPLPIPPSRRSGISISLPIYERLPSRNVSYQPAEILTVSELYRYLYENKHRHNSDDDVDHHLQHEIRLSLTADSTAESAAARNSNSGCVESDPTFFNEITSVRITGTLLCVATSNPDERGDSAKNSLYGQGTYFLIGDPLETSRLLKKEVIQSEQRYPQNAKSNAAGAATVTPKDGLASTLKSDNASDAVSSTATNAPSAQCVDASNSVTDQTEDSSTTKPSAAKPANNGNDTTNNTLKSKPLHRGILNTQKKKLVYNGGGKRLSFGGKGLGANGRVGGGSSSLLMDGRKFVTPKRIDSSTNVTKRVGFSAVMKRAPFASTRIAGSGGTSATNPKPEYVIQHHPSPIVPVWLGAFYNDDGLDGSVVGDLVMIMGEILTEYCVNCKINHSAIHSNESRNDAGNKETNAMGAECSNAGAGEESRFQSHESPTVSTQLRGVLDAATSIAGIAERISSGHQSPSPTITTKRSSCCSECSRFLSARFVKNANGTDVRLQREALLARRAYMQERKRQIDSLIPGGIVSKGIFSVGCGPPT